MNYSGKPTATTSGAGTKLTVSGYTHIGNIAADMDYTLNTLSGATFENSRNDMDEGYNIGVILGRMSESRRGTWNISGDGSKGTTYLFYLSRYSNLNVTDGGRIEIDRTPPNLLRPKDQKAGAPHEPPSYGGDDQLGAVYFNRATITSRSAAHAADWFTGITNYTVGAGGLAVEARSVLTAFAGHSVYADAEARTAEAEIVVTNVTGGSGSPAFAMGAGELPVRIRGSTRLQMTVNGRYNGSQSTGRIINETNSCRIIVSGDNSLQNMTFNESGHITRFRHQGIEADKQRWATYRAASCLANGSLRLGGTIGWNQLGYGAAWLKEKVPVNKSFTVEWTWYGIDLGNGVFGTAAVFHNDPRGYLTPGTNGHLCCYQNIAHSCAVAYDYKNSCHRFGTNGTWTQDDDLGTWTVDGQSQQARASGGSDDPLRMTLTYDADSHQLTFSSFYPNRGYRKTTTYTVDLAATVGADDAYFGFTGGSARQIDGSDMDRKGYHMIDDVRLSHEQGRGYQKVGGNAEITAGATWYTHPLSDLVNLGVTMNSLTYDNGATLDIYNATQTGLTSTEALAVNLGFDRISGTGTLTKTGFAKLALSESGAATNASVAVAAGGLILRKEDLEEPTLKAADGGWCFNGPSVHWVGDAKLQIGPLVRGTTNSNAKARELSQGATTRRRYRIDGAWTASFRIRSEVSAGNAGQGFSFVLHNDARGCEARGTDLCGSLGVQNGVALRIWNYFGNKAFAFFGIADSGNVPTRTDPPNDHEMTTAGIDLKDSGDEADYTLEHDPDNKQLNLTVKQGANTYAHTFAFDVLAQVKDTKRAFISFCARGNDDGNAKFIISNFSFKYPEGQGDENANVPYFGTLASGGTNLDFPIRLDTSISNANFRVAANPIVVKNGGKVLVSAAKAPAVADLDRIVCEGASEILLSDGCVAKVSSVTTGPTGLTVNGGVLSIVSATAFPETADIYLLNGAKLKPDFNGRIKLGRVFVNSAKVPSGVYDAASWIAEGGTGTLVIGHRGLAILIR